MQISIGEVEKVLQGSGLPAARGKKQVSTPEEARAALIAMLKDARTARNSTAP